MSDPTSTKPLPDASYTSGLHSDLARLKGFGAHVAAYVDALAGLKGQLPNGALALVDGVYTPRKGGGPTSADKLAAEYPAEPAAGPMMVIETSGDLTLTQDSLPGGHHLLVHGDIVTIKGRLYLPGRHLVILARELRTVAVPGAPGQPLQQAEIDVSAPEPIAQAAPIVPAASQGRKGTAARQNRFYSNAGNLEPGAAADELGGAGGRGADGIDGSRGAAGQRGGDIVIVCSRVGGGSTLWVNASGGRGGRGSPGQAGGTGGIGGDGKDSCDRNAGSATTFDFLDGSYRYAAALEPGPGGLGGSGGIGGPGGTGGATGNFTLIVNQPLPDDTVIENRSQRGQDGLPGEHGAAGQAGPKGSGGGDHRYDGKTGPRVANRYVPEGEPPLSGSQRLEALRARGGLPERLTTPPSRWGRHLVIHGARATDSGSMTEHPWARLRGIARVSHLHQLTETTRLRYLLWDALRFAADPAASDVDEEIGDRLDYLLLTARLLKFVTKDETLARSGAVATHAWMTLNRARGLDFFGQVPEHVELGPPSMHLRDFDEALRTLREREQAWQRYQQALAGQVTLRESRIQAADMAGKDLTEARGNVRTLADRLTTCLADIKAADAQVRAARDRLRPALGTLEAWVRQCIGLTPDDFIDVLFNLAFVGSPITEGPKRTFEVAGHGMFTAFTTLTSQTAKLVHKAIDTLPNDEGQPVRREHLLRRIDTFGGRLDDLKEAWAAVNDARRPGDPSMIRLDDPDAYRLLVVQRDFDELLDQFSTRPEARDARVALDAYVAEVQQRNELVAEYNGLAGCWLEVTGRVDAAQAQLDTVTTLDAVSSDPNLATETAFIAALYNRSREWCIECCYAASRAWRFFSLTPDDVLLSVLKLGNPREVNHTVLSAARETLGRKRSDQIRHLQLPHPPHWFPPKAAAADVPGTYVTLLPQAYALSMPSVIDASRIPDQGKSQVHLAMCESDRTLHLRIFDPRGKRVVDLPERSWKPSPLIDRLKRTYWPEQLPLDTFPDARRQRELIEIAMSLADCPLAPKADFRLHLSLTGNPRGTMPSAARSLICVAVGAGHLSLRVFDPDGRMICDRSTYQGGASPSGLSGPEIDDLRLALHPAASKRRDLPLLSDERVMEALVERLVTNSIEPAEWPKIAPDVRNFSVAVLQSADDLPGDGEGQLIVALVGPQRHLRVRFHDQQRRRVVDIDESDLGRTVPAWPATHQQQAFSALKAAVVDQLGPLLAHAEQADALMGRVSLLCELALDGCALEFAVVHDVSRLPAGRPSTVVAALVGGKGHLRIIDKAGRVAADLPHARLEAGGCRNYVEEPLHAALKSALDRRPKLTPKRQRDLIDAVARLADCPMPAWYPVEFEQLRRTGTATFRIPVPTPRMDLEANAFAGKTNVRITRVRAWVHGVRTANGRCVVVLRHKGTEVVCSRDGQPIRFTHDPVDTTFDYLADEVAWGGRDGVVKNASTVIRVDGDLPVANDDGTVYPQLVGPFAEWEITIDRPNIDVDRSGIDAIHLEFHGFAQTLEQKGPNGR